MSAGDRKTTTKTSSKLPFKYSLQAEMSTRALCSRPKKDSTHHLRINAKTKIKYQTFKAKAGTKDLKLKAKIRTTKNQGHSQGEKHHALAT